MRMELQWGVPYGGGGNIVETGCMYGMHCIRELHGRLGAFFSFILVFGGLGYIAGGGCIMYGIS